jgi:phosphoserine phosphatase RsbU/P
LNPLDAIDIIRFTSLSVGACLLRYKFMPIDSHKDETSLLLKASSQLLFETLMEHTADRIYIKDLNSRFIACSLPLARMHDYPDRQSIEGMSDFELFSMEHAQQAYDDEQELLRTASL